MKLERAIFFTTKWYNVAKKRGFPWPHSAQRGGTQPLDKKSQLRDLGSSEHRHGARPGSRHVSQCTDGRLACPAAESAREKTRPPESKPGKKCTFYTNMNHTPGINQPTNSQGTQYRWNILCGFTTVSGVRYIRRRDGIVHRVELSCTLKRLILD